MKAFLNPAADTDIIDIEEFIGGRQRQLAPYINALSRAQLSYYRKSAGIDDAIDEFYDLNADTDMKNQKLLQKAVGWILIGADV